MAFIGCKHCAQARAGILEVALKKHMTCRVGGVVCTPIKRQRDSTQGSAGR